VIDRVSTFADPAILQVIKSRTVPVAIDQAYQRRQQDAEGVFYRKIAAKSPRNNFQGTTQGLFIAAPDGTFLGYTNSRVPRHVLKIINQSLDKYQPAQVAVLARGKSDSRYNPVPPEGGLVLRVQAKVLGGYEKTDNPHRQMMIDAISRDNLWLSRAEHEALVTGLFPPAVAERIARFHLVDNTRGEPPMWAKEQIRALDIKLRGGTVTGRAHVETDDHLRGYQPEFLGYIEAGNGVVTRFDLVAKGMFWGQGTYTRNAPKGKFPLAISFSLADGTDIADRVPPQGSRGWINGYMKP
jgi:hypothetical protein